YLLLTIPAGHRSLKVLMISAVRERAPPLLAPPKPYSMPATPPDISQDLLSVMKTRGFSAAAPHMIQPSTTETANKDFIFHLVVRCRYRCRRSRKYIPNQLGTGANEEGCPEVG